MTKVVTVLQILMVLAWSVPLVLFAKYAVRRATGPHDTLRAGVWFVALSVVAFPLRWFVFGAAITVMQPLELAIWSSLYVMGALAALFLTYATYEVCRGRP